LDSVDVDEWLSLSMLLCVDLVDDKVLVVWIEREVCTSVVVSDHCGGNGGGVGGGEVGGGGEVEGGGEVGGEALPLPLPIALRGDAGGEMLSSDEGGDESIGERGAAHGTVADEGEVDDDEEQAGAVVIVDDELSVLAQG
jgi:hypothetical protein